MPQYSLEELGVIAREIAWGAGDILQAYYRGDSLNIQQKDGEPVTAADVAVSQYILDHFQAVLAAEEFGYLNEETYKATQGVIPQPWVWIIDPLDGTRDFIDKTGEYAVHIALIQDQRPVLAVVAVPETAKVYSAIQGQGAFVETRDGQRTPVQVSHKTAIADLSLVVSRTHRGERFNALLAALPCQNQRYVGSIGCKIASMVEQQTDVYISLSGKSAPKDWDMAAPELILTEAGGQFTHLDGKPLTYNTGDVNQWGCLIASNGACHQGLCEQVAATLTEIDNLSIVKD